MTGRSTDRTVACVLKAGIRFNMDNWRRNPRLAGRLHPDHPDDLQAIVHDGGPRATSTPPEVIWAKIVGCGRESFDAIALNQPQAVPRPKAGERFRFIIPAGSPFPILATTKYLRERGDWEITPCNKCGMSELFDAPSALMRLCFPDLEPGDVVEMFSSFCPLCGGAQVVRSKAATG